MRRRWKNPRIQGRQEAICFPLSGMWCANLSCHQGGAQCYPNNLTMIPGSPVLKTI
jgi:hypothetical protein